MFGSVVDIGLCWTNQNFLLGCFSVNLELRTRKVKSYQEANLCLVVKSKKLIFREIRIVKTEKKEQGQEGEGI